jgi:hypothetical protein
MTVLGIALVVIILHTKIASLRYAKRLGRHFPRQLRLGRGEGGGGRGVEGE